MLVYFVISKNDVQELVCAIFKPKKKKKKKNAFSVPSIQFILDINYVDLSVLCFITNLAIYIHSVPLFLIG